MSWRGRLTIVVSAWLLAASASTGCGGATGGGTGGAGGYGGYGGYGGIGGIGGIGGGEGGDGGSASSSSSSSSSSGGPGTGVGSACKVDPQCAPGLTCLPDTAADPIFGGGPAGGFCTAACSGDLDCATFGGVCFQLDPTQPGRCTLACTIGPPIGGVADYFAALSGDKCLGREDLRCGKAKEGVGLCLPTCGSDAQCPGRACDPRLAVCVDHPSDGLPAGAACDPMGTTLECGGLCIGFDNGAAMCASPCVLGGAKSDTADCGGAQRGFCAFGPAPNGPGDMGFCTPSCAAHADCQTPSFWCFGVPGLSDTSGKGYCFGSTPCPGGQADCDAAGQTEAACTSTPEGAFCLDPAYPIGSGGSGGAGP